MKTRNHYNQSIDSPANADLILMHYTTDKVNMKTSNHYNQSLDLAANADLILMQHTVI